jgi:hypothetical protein
MELFGNPAPEEINASFVADHTPTVFDSLAERLAKHTFVTPYVGSLRSAPTRFKVLPPDPDAAKRPRIASNPGWYSVGDYIKLSVTRRSSEERIINEVHIQFFSPDQTKPAPGEPFDLKPPDGYGTWAAGWIKGETVLWFLQKGSARRIDFTNPAQVKETTFEEAAFDKVPKEILDAMRAALIEQAAPKATSKPPAAAR